MVGSPTIRLAGFADRFARLSTQLGGFCETLSARAKQEFRSRLCVGSSRAFLSSTVFEVFGATTDTRDILTRV